MFSALLVFSVRLCDVAGMASTIGAPRRSILQYDACLSSPSLAAHRRVVLIPPALTCVFCVVRFVIRVRPLQEAGAGAVGSGQENQGRRREDRLRQGKRVRRPVCVHFSERLPAEAGWPRKMTSPLSRLSFRIALFPSMWGGAGRLPSIRFLRTDCSPYKRQHAASLTKRHAARKTPLISLRNTAVPIA